MLLSPSVTDRTRHFFKPVGHLEGGESGSQTLVSHCNQSDTTGLSRLLPELY